MSSNFFHEFLEAVSDGVAWNRYDTPTTTGRGHSTDSTREPGQKVHNYRSDRWIALKCFHEFLEAISDGVTWNRYDMLTASGWGHSTDTAREPGQKVHNYRSDCWIALKLIPEFPEAVFDGVAWNRYDTVTSSGQGHSTDNAREPGQKVHNYRSDYWIALKFFSGVSGGCFGWSCVELVRHSDDVRSGQFHRQRKRTGSKGPSL